MQRLTWIALFIVTVSLACNAPLAESSPIVTEPVEATTSDAPPTLAPTATPAPITLTLNDAGNVDVLPVGFMVVQRDPDGPDSLFVADESGLPRRQVEQFVTEGEQPDFSISADRTQILYIFEGDVWLYDGTDSRNLTNSPDVTEAAPRWWGTRTDGFISGSYTEGDDAPFGYLTYYDFATGSRTVIDNQAPMLTPPAPSPDGEIIYYTRIETPQPESNLWRYSVSGGAVRVSPAGFGRESLDVGGINLSPDGSLIGVALYANAAGDQVTAAILDPAAGSTRELFTFPTAIPGGPLTLQTPQFPPDESYAVFFGANGDLTVSGIYVADANGVNRVTPEDGQWGGRPAISPDGRYVAALNGQSCVGFLQAGQWEPIDWESSNCNALAVGWLSN